MDDEPLFIIALPPAVRPRSNRVGKRAAVITAAAGLTVGLAIGTVLNHRNDSPATGVTATASK